VDPLPLCLLLWCSGFAGFANQQQPITCSRGVSYLIYLPCSLNKERSCHSESSSSDRSRTKMVSICAARRDCRPRLPHTARLDVPPSSDASSSSSSIMSVMLLVPRYRYAWSPRAAGAKVAVMWREPEDGVLGFRVRRDCHDVITQAVNLRL
jgi:hypothetical protein